MYIAMDENEDCEVDLSSSIYDPGLQSGTDLSMLFNSAGIQGIQSNPLLLLRADPMGQSGIRLGSWQRRSVSIKHE
jgi:hypothetical protein